MNLIEKNIQILLLFIFALAFISINSQQSISMDEAVNIALKNHPQIKEGNLQIDKSMALTKSNMGIDKTSFSFSHGQMNSVAIDYQIQVSQSFSFPSYKANKKMLLAKVDLSKSQLDITKSELSKQVRLVYTSLAYLKGQLSLYHSISNLYEKMNDIADQKLKFGESNSLEKTIAYSKYQETIVTEKQIQTEINSLQQSLILLLNTEDDSILIENEIVQLPLIDSVELKQNPALNYYLQNIELAKKSNVLAKKQYLPNINLGYFNQQIDGVIGLQGVIVGLAIPIFYRDIKANVQASKIDTDISEYQLSNYHINLKNQFQQRINNYHKFKIEVDYYHNTGKHLAEKMINFSSKSYKIGEIGYSEHLQNVSIAIQIESSYLENFNLLNTEAIELMYLIGK